MKFPSPGRWLPLAVFVVVTLAAIAVVCLAVTEVQTARPSAGFSRQTNDDPFLIFVTLTVTDFNTLTSNATGTAHIEIYPKDEHTSAEAMPTGSMTLDLLHYLPPNPGEKQSYLIEGGSVKPVDISDLRHISDVDFSWRASAQVLPFLYPFDSYTLHLYPELSQSTDTTGVMISQVVDTATVNLETTSMRMQLTPLATTDRDGDPAVVVLERPLAIRVVAVVVAVLAVIWLIYLAILAETNTFTGGIISFFVGVWGLRATLMSGVSIFPALIDYVVLAFSVVAVGIMLARWSSTLVAPPARQCPYCKQSVAKDATRCPHCTSELQPSSALTGGSS